MGILAIRSEKHALNNTSLEEGDIEIEKREVSHRTLNANHEITKPLDRQARLKCHMQTAWIRMRRRLIRIQAV